MGFHCMDVTEAVVLPDSTPSLYSSTIGELFFSALLIEWQDLRATETPWRQ